MGLIKLTSHQQTALDLLKSWWKTEEQHFVLEGKPGTGKTFLLKEFDRVMSSARIIYTAPTNEAVRQMELSLGDGQTCKTCYSALDLGLSYRQEVPRIYQRRVSGQLDEFNLMVIDEASMVGGSLDVVYTLLSRIAYAGLRCIWLGDRWQLPSVGEPKTRSPVFYTGWTGISLDEVVRHSGKIYDYVSKVRDNLEADLLEPPEPPEGMTHKTNGSELRLTDEDYKNFSSGDTKILCWTNKRARVNRSLGVKEYNDIIRRKLFGADADRELLLIGDKIIFNTPAFASTKGFNTLKELDDLKSGQFSLRHTTNTKGTVVRLGKDMYLGISCYLTVIAVEGQANYVCYVPTSAGKPVWEAHLKKLKSRALKLKTKVSKNKAWTTYHLNTQVMADLKHCYAMTGHKAQGSSIPNVLIARDNIFANGNRLEALKNYNVCCSRASSTLRFFV